MPLHGAFARHGIPAAQDHLRFLPARLVAILANAAGTLAVVAVALRSLRRRPLANVLIVLGVVAAAVGSGTAGLGAGGAAVGVAVGAALLYAGFVAPATFTFSGLLTHPLRKRL
jgi:Flp pilus assembly protein protease CpaA